MKIFKLGKGVFGYYRKNVKGNEKIDYQAAQKKLTRNIHLAVRVPMDEGSDMQMYLYGNLHIFVRENEIVKLKNHTENLGDWFYKDKKTKAKLNKRLGIKITQKELKVSA